MKPDRNATVEPNWEERCEELKKSNCYLREEFECLAEKHCKGELENEQLRARIEELEKENLFFSGQIEAFKYCAKEGVQG